MNAYQNYFSESHQILRAATRKLIDKEVKPYIQQWEEHGCIPDEIFHKVGAAGLLAIGYPEEYGGTIGDVFHSIVVTEEIMRAGAGGLAASLGSIHIGLPPIVRDGSAAMKQHVIPEVISGQKVICLAITEPSGGSDVANLKTRAVREGNYYRVNGSKMFITNGSRADYYTVAVRTGEKGYGGISLLLLEKNTPGLTLGRNLKKMGWWCSDTAELFFADCKVPVEHLIGEENKGFYSIMANFQNERLSLAVMANMTAQLAFEASKLYMQEREAFDKKLTSFQVLRHKLAEMATLIEASREFTYRVAAKMNAEEYVVKEISMAKNFSTQVSDKVTYDAVQIFGGMGFMRETLVERLYRDNRLLAIGGGTYEIMNEVIYKML